MYTSDINFAEFILGLLFHNVHLHPYTSKQSYVFSFANRWYWTSMIDCFVVPCCSLNLDVIFKFVGIFYLKELENEKQKLSRTGNNNPVSIHINHWSMVCWFWLFTGQFSCGNKHCDENEGLKSWEVNFGYVEHGEKRNALVKLSESALLGYVHLREDMYLVLWMVSSETQ